MSIIITSSSSVFVEQLHKIIRAKLTQSVASSVQLFAIEFFNQYPLSDIENRTREDVFGMVNEAYNFIKTFHHRASIRVFNPTMEGNQWQCSRSIIMVHCKNTPFLMDSVRMALTNHGLEVRAVKSTPLAISRDKTGGLVSIHSFEQAKAKDIKEALLYFEVNRQADEKEFKAIASTIRATLGDIKLVTSGYSKTLAAVRTIRKSLGGFKKTHSKTAIHEAEQFLSWLTTNNFAFLGYAYTSLKRDASKKYVATIDRSSISGILKDEKLIASVIKRQDLTKGSQKRLIAFSKLPIRSTVHRYAYTDQIKIKDYDENGNLVGKHHIVGLYTSAAYRASVFEVPVIRTKIERLYTSINTELNSYNGRVIRQVLETYPRDELFQSNGQRLTESILRISQINERLKVRLFMRADTTNTFVNAMVYVPREVFSSRLRENIVNLLSAAVSAESHEFSMYYSESVLCRLYVTFLIGDKHNTQWDTAALELQIKALAHTWTSSLAEGLQARFGEDKGAEYAKRFASSFPASYQDSFKVDQALQDIHVIDSLNDGQTLALNLCPLSDASSHRVHFKMLSLDVPLVLSDVIPVLEKMNLKVIGEHPYKLCVDDKHIWLHDFELDSELLLTCTDFGKLKERFEDTFNHVWMNDADNDRFNGLVLSANIDWREVVVLRAYASYMKQTLFPISQDAIKQTLLAYPEITRQLVTLFHTHFDPQLESHNTHELTAAIVARLEDVSNLNDDRILRRFLDFINGTLRTNFYQRIDGKPKAYVSFKFNPREIADIPEPRPKYEIFVYSPRVEGVHLRGGKVARGGLRWSERNEDFRTEVLGLVKAQQVKNAVIVPNGAKGGFIAKQASMQNGRDSFIKEGIACYQIFIRGLLDITDNLVKGKVIPPLNVVRLDDDDPYLVVAADKGTATFSDIANEISFEYKHWLGDAFASGGSQGYDHKGMGITARGAWVSVQRHFKEQNVNVQEQNFSVIGIGDMAGDVFGNGMLMSKHICLTAAFNHLHIFIDPTPDAEKSFVERERLFNSPGTNWEDYNKKLISKGGGIFSRNAKSIAINKDMKLCFDITADKLTPVDLIHALLKAPVDLIWNGGIGTYVKSCTESHADVGDKANDGLRVNGADLRCKVFGEGGNLGASQLGRIEFALRGGFCNTDFIDNSAGVDCSDHEVNIKILLNESVVKGELTPAQRNRQLVAMTDTVAEMVLNNNYYQTQSISLAEKEGLARNNEYRRLINSLESSGRLSRKLEFIPSDDELVERVAGGQSLTRPELAVLNCYVKSQLKEELAVDAVANNEYLSSWVEKAFPKQLLKKYKSEIHSHILRKEIIATQLANDMVDNMGITFFQRIVESTGESAANIAIAYVAARDIFRFDEFQNSVEALDYKVSADDQLQLLISMMRRVRRGTRWFLRNRRDRLNLTKDVPLYAKHVISVIKETPRVLNATERQAWSDKCARFEQLGLKNDWASLMAMPSFLFSGLGVADAVVEDSTSVASSVEMHHLLGDKLGLYWFAIAVSNVKVDNHWQAKARESFIDDIDKVLRVMSVSLLSLAGKKYPLEEALQLWMQEHTSVVSRWRTMATELESNVANDFAIFSVAMGELKDLMDACNNCKKLSLS
ncbi:MAG: glutamate dehydrogenase [Pseudohongiellaceae bacterium]|jgi:glutamate dehydrogenase